MMTIPSWTRVWASIALCVLVVGPLRGEDRATAAARKGESDAVKKSVAALVKSAKELTAVKAYDAALEELRLAAVFAPADGGVAGARQKVGSNEGPTPEHVLARVAKAQGTARSACAKNFLRALDAWAKAERPQGYARLATQVRSAFGADPAFEALELDWYEPYLVWTRKEDIERWERGDDCVDSGWLDAAEVEKQNARHLDWKDPWVVDDGVNEVRTVMPLRAANRVLFYVTSYREFVSGYFGADWEWKAPRGKLPIYLAETQAEYQARLQEHNPGAQKSKAAALYLQKSSGLGPVLVTFEPLAEGTPTKIEWHTVLRDVRHEVAHQLLYESCMAQGASVGGNIDWVSEGLANYLGSYRPDRGAWKLAKVKQEPFGTGMEPGPFWWVKENPNALPTLKKFFTETRANLESVQEYWIATTVVHFLLNGVEGRYRDPIVKLATEVHMARGDSKSFSECFGKVDFDQMETEWKDFVSKMTIDEESTR